MANGMMSVGDPLMAFHGIRNINFQYHADPLVNTLLCC